MLDKSSLTEVGLTNNEAEIYSILLKLREALAYEISKQTRISRSHVYDSLNSLLEKGLINYIRKDKKRFYHITDPKKLIQILEEKENKISKQKEELKKKISSLKEKEQISSPKVEVYEGVEGIKFIMEDVIEDGRNKKYKEILVMNSFSKEEFVDIAPELAWDRFWNLRKRYKIYSRQLYSQGKKITKHPYIKSGILPKEYFNNKIVHFIYGEKMIYFIFSLNPLVIRIRDPEISKLYKNQFEILWGKAKK